MALGGPGVQVPLAVVIALAFVASILAESAVVSLRLKARTEARRQAAEVVESEMWQFCLRAPAAYNTDDDVAALNLYKNVRARISAHSADLPADAFDGLAPSVAMLGLRAGTVNDRHDGYIADRVGEIVQSSRSQSRLAESRALRAQIMIVVLLFAGAGAAVSRAAGWLQLNLLGLFLALVGAVSGWLQIGEFTATETSAKARSAFFLNAASEAQRFSQDNKAWFDVVNRIESRAAPVELS
jgi:hypothetical protein